MNEPRLAHVMIFVKDAARMAAFYENALSLGKEASEEPGFVVLTSPAGAGIALHALPEVFRAIEIQSPPVWREETCLKPCFEVADLEAARRRILECGGQVKEPWQWEGISFSECADPEGNVFQIFRRSP